MVNQVPEKVYLVFWRVVDGSGLLHHMSTHIDEAEAKEVAQAFLKEDPNPKTLEVLIASFEGPVVETIE